MKQHQNFLIDHLCVSIPINPEFVGHSPSVDSSGNIKNSYYLKFDPLDIGLSMASKSVYKEDGLIKSGSIYHPFESVATSHSGIACKFFFDPFYYPHLLFKASPAKVTQGHNVFGHHDLEKAYFDLLNFVLVEYSCLTPYLSIESASLQHIDLTFSVNVGSQDKASECIKRLSTVKNKNFRDNPKIFDSSVYWGSTNSRLIQHKCYMKHNELQSEYKKALKSKTLQDRDFIKTIDSLDLLNYSKGLLRFESRIKHRWFERRGVSCLMTDLIKLTNDNPDFLLSLYHSVASPLFDSFSGVVVDFKDDDDIYDFISSSPFVLNSKGKPSPTKIRNLFGAYCLLREKGWDSFKSSYSNSQFYKLVSDLIEVGFSREQLQQDHLDRDQFFLDLSVVLKKPFDKFFAIDHTLFNNLIVVKPETKPLKQNIDCGELRWKTKSENELPWLALENQKVLL